MREATGKRKRVGRPSRGGGAEDKKSSFAVLAPTGLFCGFINGFFGGGGGMIVVPMLKKFCRYEEKIAHATAIAVILPISVLSGLLNVLNLKTDLLFLIVVTIGSAVGGVIGALFLKNAKPELINFLFVIVMITAGARLAFF